MRYLLQNIDEDLWAAIRHHAIDINESVRAIIEVALQDYRVKYIDDSHDNDDNSPI